MTSNKLKIAITGGIGSGKTAVTKYLRNNGYVAFSCDEEANEIYKIHSVKVGLKKFFKKAVKGEKRLRVDRKQLSREVFDNPEKLDLLNTYTHSIIMERIAEKTSKALKKQNVVFVEVPLLFESGYQNCFDKVIVIKRPIKERIESVIKRSGLTKEETLKRISSQFDYDTADLSKYTVIENDGDKSRLYEKIQRIISNL